MKQLVFFASGSGTNFQSVIDAIQSGLISAKIRGLIVNKRGIGARGRAQKNKIPAQVIPPEQAGFETQLLETLQKWRPDLIVLAGYMFKIPAAVIEAYPEQIINIHPSLLPKFGGKGFYGKKVHAAVLKAGETETGCSVHIVTKEYDQGRILGQRPVAVHASDTPKELAARVLEQEHQLLPEVIKNYLSKL